MKKREKTYDFHVSFLQEEKRTRVLVGYYKSLEKIIYLWVTT
jgi:hypothetical protein